MKNSYKIILCSLTLILLCLFVVYADISEEFSDYFDRPDGNTIGGSWNEIEYATGNNDTKTLVRVSNESIRIDATQSHIPEGGLGKYAFINLTDEQRTNTLMIQFSIKKYRQGSGWFRGDGHNGFPVIIGDTYNPAHPTDQDDRSFGIYVSGNHGDPNGDIYINYESEDHLLTTATELDNWYNIRMIADWGAQKVNFYIYNTATGNLIAESLDNPMANKGNKHLAFGWAGSVGYGTVRIDNVTLSSPPPGNASPIISSLGIVSYTNQSLTLSWETDKPSDSKIYCGLNIDTLSSFIATDSSMNTTHTIKKSTLSPGTKYYCNVSSKVVSPQDNITTSGPISITLLTNPGNASPIITGPSDENTANTSTEIIWSTDKGANSTLCYGTLTYSTCGHDAEIKTEHRFYLYDLLNYTTYIYNVTSCISSPQSNCTSISSSFMTLQNPFDGNGTAITNTETPIITKYTSKFSWNTTNDVNGTVCYGIDSYGNCTGHYTLSKNHTVTLENLNDGTSYIYNITSCVKAPIRNCTGITGSFYTLSKIGNHSPEIAMLKNTTTTNSSTIISWSLDKESNSSLCYGEFDYSNCQFSGELKTSASFSLSNLTEYTNYIYTAESCVTSAEDMLNCSSSTGSFRTTKHWVAEFNTTLTLDTTLSLIEIASTQVNTSIIFYPKANISGNVLIRLYNENPVSTAQEKLPLKYINIETDIENIEDYVNGIILNMLYSDEEISQAGLNGSSILAYKYDQSLVSWASAEAFQQSLDETGDRISLENISFGLWGIFGNAPVYTKPPTSIIFGGGSGSSGTFIIPPPREQDKNNEPKKEEKEDSTPNSPTPKISNRAEGGIRSMPNKITDQMTPVFLPFPKDPGEKPLVENTLLVQLGVSWISIFIFMSIFALMIIKVKKSKDEEGAEEIIYKEKMKYIQDTYKSMLDRDRYNNHYKVQRLKR